MEWMEENSGKVQLWLTSEPRESLDFLVGSRLIAVGAELFDLQPFGGVPAVLLGGVTGHPGGPLGGIGPAFGALESDYDPDALVFGHKDVAPLVLGGVTIRQLN